MLSKIRQNVEFFKINLNTIATFVLASIAFCMAISLLSFHAGDMEYIYPPQPIKNWFGIAGAKFALITFKWLGWVAWLLPISSILLLLVLRLSRGSCPAAMQAAGLLLLILVWAATTASYLDPVLLISQKMPSYGGILGLFVKDFLRGYISNKVAAILLIMTGIFWLLQVFLCYEQLNEHHQKSLSGTNYEQECT